MSIQILSDDLISQIAAGEVIERPSSALKELVENSIDANASQITVELDEGGLRMIRVVDNGHGIHKADARLAFTRHATSKLYTIEDLFDIHSMGFRGEALASIASIARVDLRSKHEDERTGFKIEMDGGKELSFEESGGEHGTEIVIRGLFRHTPARKKYMKTERTEYGHCFDTLTRIALAHPRVGFKFLRDGQEIFSLAPDQDLKERIRVLFGGQTSNALIPVSFHQSNLVLNGYVGKPELSRRSRKYQFLFVNGRAIDSRALNHAVKEAFHSLLMHEKHPWYVLNVEIDPQMVDVNVHPRKLEVKFVNPQEVFKAVRGSVHHALEGNMLSPVYEEPAALDLAVLEAPKLDLSGIRSFAQNRSFAPAAQAEAAATVEVAGLAMRPVAQIAHSYIVAESEEGLVLIDQHAAHERVRYEKLMTAMEAAAPMTQPLLTPLEIDLGADGAHMFEKHREEFAAMGFELEAFGGHSVLLRAVPAGLEQREPEALLRDLMADAKTDSGKNMREFLLTYTACRGAIKFGDRLTMIEMEALLRDMQNTENCTHCPHGRPAIITFSFDKLETLFKRKNF